MVMIMIFLKVDTYTVVNGYMGNKYHGISIIIFLKVDYIGNINHDPS